MAVNVSRVIKTLGDDFTVIDASGHILGRLSSKIAKRLLNGERIVVVNAEKAVITGDKYMVFERYKEKYDRGSKEKGPYFPRHPERIFKRTVRGMLPWKSSRGRDAYRRLRVFMGVPEELQGREFEKIEDALLEKVSKTDKYVTLAEVSRYLGFRGV
ncbi:MULTISPECIES: 50S ribosomal protein L13 [Archaeoglobus]|jgi:large subunit ribosomal protein L13|uniref:Large ribosomal subunit protein uL13 n=3 Tax=Archaeoglobus fulgidus TaxID=2234 RepID=RL13_ARCFU|nr:MULTISPECIES: 50S ribosomal protein L13 [Archaeoglobus]O29137.1 RecName: Full=Large ribosomal subunit protein uL13; AltName: Full=50S ribosomal protein L13 [Archaeoglobus fulgidus DSM 4304]AAB90114.1 LSU ribosomal protein L13P (rpl13P) [Archaeoglobus fulgidus DSM 4304]AIG98004.1 ribosomal protein L13, archaeal/eukaryotic [Archaeoglobus fulgidus DSM 8774]KUJ94097.1 MAG: 50S ribosomal protein L13P [Archaeoglobus fulgidus]KUK07687.1 MAG: 50S ribosomal protein L13P [Archaeoglobus fulgidus]MDI3